MSGIYIPGMEMPTNCRDCPIGDSLCCGLMHGVPALWKEYTNAIRTNRRNKDCPLIPVPEHGRLGDLDAFKSIKYELPNGQKAFNRGFHSGVQYVQRIVMAAPTIIPADKEVDE